MGTDIAELLLSFVSESKITEIKPLLQPKVCDPLGEDHVQLSEADMTNKFRDLLLYGNKKEALGMNKWLIVYIFNFWCSIINLIYLRIRHCVVLVLCLNELFTISKDKLVFSGNYRIL